MPQKLKVELQDENGNVYYLHTAADVVFLEDGTTVEAALEAKVTKSGGDIADTVVSAIDASSDSFPVLKENSKPRKFLGQINKWFSDCLTKFGNYILTTAISNQQINSTTNVPSSALAYLMQQAIVANQSSIGVLNTKQSQTEIDLQNRYVKAAESITDCLVDTIYPGTYIYGDTAINRPVTGAEMGGTIFTFGNLGWWTIRIAISNDLRLFLALHTIGASYGSWKEI